MIALVWVRRHVPNSNTKDYEKCFTFEVKAYSLTPDMCWYRCKMPEAYKDELPAPIHGHSRHGNPRMYKDLRQTCRHVGAFYGHASAGEDVKQGRPCLLKPTPLEMLACLAHEPEPL